MRFICESNTEQRLNWNWSNTSHYCRSCRQHLNNQVSWSQIRLVGWFGWMVGRLLAKLIRCYFRFDYFLVCLILIWNFVWICSISCLQKAYKDVTQILHIFFRSLMEVRTTIINAKKVFFFSFFSSTFFLLFLIIFVLYPYSFFCIKLKLLCVLLAVFFCISDLKQ